MPDSGNQRIAAGVAWKSFRRHARATFYSDQPTSEDRPKIPTQVTKAAESGKMKKTIPTYEEAKDELGEDAMSFFMDMVRQDNAPPDKEEIPPPATDENKGLSKP